MTTVDEWAWGKEQIIWGYHPSHQYTLKILEPKRGRDGCLSLQYHLDKSETWIAYRGLAWALVVVQGTVATAILRPGNILPLPQGTIHRLMAISDDCQIIEPSTPDRHASDKSVPKDVIRLHCVFGRPVAPPRNEQEREIIERCIEITEEAIKEVEAGREPPIYHPEALRSLGASSL